MLKDWMAGLPVIEAERVILRPFVPEDAGDMRLWLGRDEVYTYWGRKASRGEREPELLFTSRRPWNVPRDDLRWAIVDRESGRVIGDLSLFHIENQRMGDVGYRLAPELWGQGLMTEALGALIRTLFTETELQRLQATADVRNLASCRVLEKCGFVREGTVRQGKMVSVYCDYHIYGLLPSDLPLSTKS